jgi:hypothetical protein
MDLDRETVAEAAISNTIMTAESSLYFLQTYLRPECNSEVHGKELLDAVELCVCVGMCQADTFGLSHRTSMAILLSATHSQPRDMS